MATLIELFEVAPGDDEAFLADWRRERGGDATLYRALRDDVALRFVSVSPGPGYELEHEDGTPDLAGGATQITPFADDALLPAWHRLREAMASRRGYLGTRLYRAVTPSDARWIAITRWSSPPMVARAAREVEFPSHAALYQEAD